jgi:hypothetical protein
VLSQLREDGSKQIRYALIKENHCHGFEQKRQLTVREWMDGQGLTPFNENNDLMMDIISLKNQYIPGPLKGHAQSFFYTMCYDIDRLKENGGPAWLEHIEVPEAEKNDDEKLLRFSLNYLKKYFLALGLK